MEEEIKVHFEELAKRIEINEKRFGDIKWYFGGVTCLLAIGFSVFFLVLSWNLNSEKIALHEFKKDIRADLGIADLPPNLVLLGENCRPLKNQDIKAEALKAEDGSIKLKFTYAIKNDGKSPSGPLYNIVYTSNPIEFNYNSIDEPKYDYVSYGSPRTHTHDELPGGNFIGQYELTLFTKNKEIPPIGKYPILLKIYYGKGKLVCANFNLVLDR